MTSPEVLVIGTLVADIRVRPFLPVRPREGVVLHRVDDISLLPGGLVSNTGLALARLGVKTGALSRVGKDAIGDLLRDRLAAEGLDVTGIIQDPDTPTTTVVVCVDRRGERTFHRCEGADMRLTPEDIAAFLPRIAAARLVIVGYLSELPSLDQRLPDLLALLKRTTQTSVLLETSAGFLGRTAGPTGETRAILDACLPNVDIFLPSWEEARGLTGLRSPQAALANLATAAQPSIMGVKLGRRGCLVRDGRRSYREPAYPITALDATGAGDTFLAGFVAAHLRGLDTRTCCKVGNLAAALTIGALDRSTALPSLPDLLDRLEQTIGH